MFDKSTPHEPVQHPLHHRPQGPVLPGCEARGPDAQQLLEVLLHQTEERRVIVRQRASGRMRALYRSDTGVLAWWGARVECHSGLSRLERDGLLLPRPASRARGRLDRFAATWHEVRAHDLRAADSLQLAAATAASEGRPVALAFLCLDERLSAAAERRGFPVLGGASRR